MNKYFFEENNSGGYWRMNLKKFNALLDNGWELKEGWNIKVGFTDPMKPFNSNRPEDDAPYGYRHNSIYFEAKTIKEAVESFEKNTGLNFFEQGCNCCGVPFSIRTGQGEEKWESISGDDASISVNSPW